ncbi:hypothetical protein BKA58DRAFT_45288 [Alternaria rosae]|uniref:uncharacterized protein n=1 Tax=Alternaria rosae TaxID=1187941 RepID=UPI001E8EC02A|nr:uncharacterized protein BKA58DRAFT_45288 [Alternaria rosae]KAH6861061.1 hypothetical protein BKA58DRAFT_45288 [Alternaria rosae]
MSGSQYRPGGSSGGSGYNGGGGGNSSSCNHSHTNSTWRGGASTSSTQSNSYDPNNDSVYARVSRPLYPNGAANDYAAYTAPPAPRPQVQQARAYTTPHQFETGHSSSHLPVFPYQSSESDFYSSPPPHASSSTGHRTQPEQGQYPYQSPSGGAHPIQTAQQRSGPYEAIGYIRRDGAVYDKDEVYEEYRPYAHQRGQQQYYESN